MEGIATAPCIANAAATVGTTVRSNGLRKFVELRKALNMLAIVLEREIKWLGV
jgi:hypothetical protein